MKKSSQMKKILSSILISTCIVLPSGVSAVEVNNEAISKIGSKVTLAKEESKSKVKVYFNGKQIEFDQEPIIVNGRTKVPFRAIFEEMGTVVYYRDDDKSVLGLTRDGDVIKHTVGTNKATINGVEKTYDSISEIKNDRTLIPVRMVSDLLSASVEWKDKEKEVQIEKKIETSGHNKLVMKILECTLNQNFNPEDFKRYIEYQYKNPGLTPEQVVLNVNMDLDREMIEVDSNLNIPGGHQEAKKEDISIIRNTDDMLMLINRFNKLPDNYEPKNIIRVDRQHHRVMGEIEIDARIYEDYKEMFNAAVNDGMDIRILRGLAKSEISVEALFEITTSFYLQQESYGYNLSPLYRFNELETGLSIDMVACGTGSYPYYLQYSKNHNILGVDGNRKPLSQSQFDRNYNEFLSQIYDENLKFEWLENNSYKYGFIVRYPKYKEEITKYYHAPWHFRYVGKEIAKIMHDENLCFEEYCAKYLNPSGYKTDLESTKRKVLKLN